ncbi:hypothetical protein HYDPIDRAFT_25879 [Hydnomerulius pinastri MD-312]|nr:hypothetical protein HYDPIDRAFT_25879 [Hydnomerulius pinastri MD-312]
MTSLLALPPELIESIIISSRSPHTLSSLSQTSRALHTLIYASPDSHLWRELFLTTWDDPRPALAHTALIHPDDAQWDWGKEYRARVNAEMCATAWRRGVCVADDATSGEDNTDALSDPSLLPTLRALLSTLLTLTPFPSSPPIALTVLTPSISPFPTGNLESGQGERRERMTSAPPLPPLLLLLASGFKAVKASKSGERMDRIVYGPHHSTPYPPLHLATPSLPPQLTRTLLPSLSIGVRGLSAHTPSLSGAEFWAEDELGQIFHRILCITGFVPIPQPLPTPSSAPRPRPDPFPSPAQQYADARILARRRVYDMRYLRADRAWGPFQVVDRSASTSARNGRGGRLGRGAGASGSKAPRSASNRPGRGLGTLAWAMGMEVDDDDEGDEDWHDAEDGDKEGSSSSSSSDNTREGEVGNDGGADDDDEESDSEPEVEHPLISLILPTPPTTTTPGRRTRRQPPGDPISPPAIKPHQLRPDYAYLAAVRIVVEANLKELLGGRSHDDEDADVGLPVRRGGGDADVEEGIPPDVGLFWEDEGHAGEGSRSGTSALQLQLHTPTPTPTDTEAQTFELADILARFRSLEVARIGGACGYWGGWVGRSARRGDVRADSSSNSNFVGGGEDVRDKGKGKAKAKADEEDHGEGAGGGVDDWEEGPAGESCEGWDWAGVSGIWRWVHWSFSFLARRCSG